MWGCDCAKLDVTGQIRLGRLICTYNFDFDWLLHVTAERKFEPWSPLRRSVNMSCETRNCIENEPEYAVCVISITRLCYEALGVILCDLIWQIRHNYNRLGYGHCNVTGHRKMSVLGTTGAMVTTYETFRNDVIVKGPKCFCVLWNLLEMQQINELHIIVLSIN